MALFILGFGLVGSAEARAQDDRLVTDFEHFYDDITIDKLAKLYWRLNMFDINDNKAVDNYLRINECDIYLEYVFNELEWDNIREKARNHLKNNVETFPDRFKFEQPLRLADYNPETEMFAIMPAYQIDGIRKFEVFSEDMNQRPCGDYSSQRNADLEGYWKALKVELNQPLNLSQIPIKRAVASRYIDKKMDQFLELPQDRQKREMMYSLRDAYLVMKIRVFSYKGTERITNGRTRAIVYAMLEGFEIYADRAHEQLLYFENFIRKSEKKPLNVRLKEQFEELKRERSQ